MFKQMIKDSEMGLFNAVIVHKLDRFSRDRYDSAFYKRQLKKNGVRIISVLENLDDSPESIILESILEGMAEYYSKNLAREVMKGMNETALKAKHNGGIPPLGFDVAEDKTYIINQAEAIIVKKIFEMYLQGYGYIGIADELNNQGYKTKAGNAFSKNSIYEMLINEKYKGTYVFNKRSSKNLGKRNNHTFKDESEIIKIPGGMPAIIDEATFDKAYSKIKGNKRGPRVGGKSFYLLTGYLYCGQCGSRYVGCSYRGGRGGKKYPIYECSKRDRTNTCKNKAIRQSIIEELVVKDLLENVFAPEEAKKISQRLAVRVKEYDQESQEELVYIQKALDEANSKIEKLIDAVVDGVLDTNIIKNKMDNLKQEKAQLESRLYELEFKSYDWVDEDKIFNFLMKSKENLLSEDNLLRRKVIETFIDKSAPPVKRVVCSEAISLCYRPAPKDAGFHIVQATMPLPLLPPLKG